MSDHQNGQEHLLKQLISTFRCHVCRRSFEREHVRVAAREKALWMVSVRCVRCRNQQVFLVHRRPADTDSVLRDVSDREQEQFAAMTAVSGNDVLDMHEFLAEFNGDFRSLFAAERFLDP